MNNNSNNDDKSKRAGRKPLYPEFGNMDSMRVTLPGPYKRLVREVGDGELSEGTRRMIEFWIKEHDIDLPDQ